jgi:hypothetical protein
MKITHTCTGTGNIREHPVSFRTRIPNPASGNFVPKKNETEKEHYNTLKS